jgi:hypothetical protein
MKEWWSQLNPFAGETCTNYYNLESTESLVEDDINRAVALLFIKKSESFRTDYIDFREIAEIIATFGGIYGTVMLFKNFIFVNLLERMLKQEI